MRSVLEAFKSLSTRLLLLTLLWVSFIVLSIGYTMLLSWQLEESASSLQTIGELRYHAFRSALYAESGRPQDEVRREIVYFQDEMGKLINEEVRWSFDGEVGDKLHERLQDLEGEWRKSFVPMLLRERSGEALNRLTQVNAYCEELSQLADAVAHERNRSLKMMRVIEWVIIVLAIGSLFVIMNLLIRWVIQPLETLGNAIFLLSNGRMSHRVNLRGKDEMNLIGSGFNHMSARLQDLYASLEKKVADKTEALEVQNRRLEDLYDATSFLSHQRTMDETFEGFLERLSAAVGADAMQVLWVDEKTGHLSAGTSLGLDNETAQAFDGVTMAGSIVDRCISKNRVVRQALTFVEPREGSRAWTRAGFVTAYCAPLDGHPKGVVCLLFRSPMTLGVSERQLLESFVAHLGISIENGRLNDRERLYAVMQERQLMARGLHDSIAQVLNYLNLQVQFLSDGIARGDARLRDDSLAAIRTGLKECYEDVRELLLNFRERVHKESFVAGVRTVINRFEAQARNVEANLRVVDRGSELSDKQKLQVIFIIQEALSNVRKHARASAVNVTIDNREDLVVTVEDNGVGLDPDVMESRKDRHVGLSIMNERASRIGATVDIARVSAAGGTRVTLKLPAELRE